MRCVSYLDINPTEVERFVEILRAEGRDIPEPEKKELDLTLALIASRGRRWQG